MQLAIGSRIDAAPQGNVIDIRPEFLYNAAFRLLAAWGRLVIVNLWIKAAPSNRAAAADRIVRFVGIALAPIGEALAGAIVR